jgi:hypothetical protein
MGAIRGVMTNGRETITMNSTAAASQKRLSRRKHGNPGGAEAKKIRNDEKPFASPPANEEPEGGDEAGETPDMNLNKSGREDEKRLKLAQLQSSGKWAAAAPARWVNRGARS